MLIGMHMANELLSVPVAAATLALAGGVVAAAAARVRRTLDPERLPLMGVLGAFVFAGQMINVTLPGMPGTSGHLGGGVLLAIVLGPAAAIVTMAAILIVQCLMFQDGGLLALGCNILNMGVVPCLLGWGLYRALLGAPEAAPPWRQYLAAWAACVAGVTLGAALVPLEAAVSGVMNIPLTGFLAVMVGVHLIIGFVEGLITFAVVAYLRKVRPALVGAPAVGTEPRRLGRKPVLATLLATALILAGGISWLASRQPDGLEWSYQVHRYGDAAEPVKAPSGLVARVDDWQSRYALLPDYGRRSAPLGQTPGEAPSETEAPDAWPGVSGWGSLAGLLGTVVTLAVVYVVAVLLRRRRTLPGGARQA
jgi:cobalt/nickel transport system permease protein